MVESGGKPRSRRLSILSILFAWTLTALNSLAMHAFVQKFSKFHFLSTLVPHSNKLRNLPCSVNEYSLSSVWNLPSFNFIACPFVLPVQDRREDPIIFSLRPLFWRLFKNSPFLSFLKIVQLFSKSVFSSALLYLAKEASQKLTLHLKCVGTLRLSLNEFWVALLLAWLGWKMSRDWWGGLFGCVQVLPPRGLGKGILMVKSHPELLLKSPSLCLCF